MARIPLYILAEEYTFGAYNNTKTLSQGAFLKPIRLEYLPAHVFDSPFSRYYSKNSDTFCYTHYGIVPIPNDLIQEVTW